MKLNENWKVFEKYSSLKNRNLLCETIFFSKESFSDKRWTGEEKTRMTVTVPPNQTKKTETKIQFCLQLSFRKNKMKIQKFLDKKIYLKQCWKLKWFEEK